MEEQVSEIFDIQSKNTDRDNTQKDIVSPLGITLQQLSDIFSKYFHAVFSFKPYPYQIAPSKYILKSAIEHDGEEYILEWARQSGKSTTMAGIASFLGVLPSVYRNKLKPYTIGIFAPKYEQTHVIFTKVYTAINSDLVKHSIGVNADIKNREFFILNNGSIIRTFSASDKSNIEGMTLDFAIIDEAQNVSDAKYSIIFPMLSSTNGARVLIGTAKTNLRSPSGAVTTYFYNRVHELKEPKCWIIDYQIASNCNPRYKEFILKEIKRVGIDSDEFQTQYALRWIISRSKFIEADKFELLIDKTLIRRSYSDEDIVVGYDVGKTEDSTVLTFVSRASNGLYIIRDWLELQGDNYEEQFLKIRSYISTYMPRIKAIAIDSVGIGDPVFEKWNNLEDREFAIIPITNSPSLRHEVYRNLQILIESNSIRIPADDSTEFIRFKLQLLELEKVYSSQGYLKLQHPNKRNAHDDYIHSLAYALYIAKDYIVTDTDMSEITVTDTANNSSKYRIYHDDSWRQAFIDELERSEFERLWDSELFRDTNIWKED